MKMVTDEWIGEVSDACRAVISAKSNIESRLAMKPEEVLSVLEELVTRRPPVVDIEAVFEARRERWRIYMCAALVYNGTAKISASIADRAVEEEEKRFQKQPEFVP